MSGRVLHDAREVRVVELSMSYERYSSMPVLQTVAMFRSSDWRAPEVTLARPGSDGVEQFTLSLEELDTLLSAYTQYRHDREADALAKAEVSEDWDLDLDDLDNHPF